MSFISCLPTYTKLNQIGICQRHAFPDVPCHIHRRHEMRGKETSKASKQNLPLCLYISQIREVPLWPKPEQEHRYCIQRLPLQFIKFDEQ